MSKELFLGENPKSKEIAYSILVEGGVNVAITQLARMNFAINSILEKASMGVGLSKRAAIALALLSAGGTAVEGLIVSNQALQEQFVRLNISSELSVKKDVSTVKGELLQKQYIEIRGKVSQFGLTQQGREAITAMSRILEACVNETGFSFQERSLLREIINLSDGVPQG